MVRDLNRESSSAKDLGCIIYCHTSIQILWRKGHLTACKYYCTCTCINVSCFVDASHHIPKYCYTHLPHSRINNSFLPGKIIPYFIFFRPHSPVEIPQISYTGCMLKLRCVCIDLFIFHSRVVC